MCIRDRVKQSSKVVTKEVVDLLIDQYNKIETEALTLDSLCQEPNTSYCPRLAGPCHFSITNFLPCRHLFLLRREKNEELFQLKGISDRWKISSNTVISATHENSAEFTSFKILHDSPNNLKLKCDFNETGNSTCNTSAYTFKRKTETPSTQCLDGNVLRKINLSFERHQFGYKWNQSDLDAITGENENIKWLSDTHMDFVNDLSLIHI